MASQFQTTHDAALPMDGKRSPAMREEEERPRVLALAALRIPDGPAGGIIDAACRTLEELNADVAVLAAAPDADLPTRDGDLPRACRGYDLVAPGPGPAGVLLAARRSSRFWRVERMRGNYGPDVLGAGVVVAGGGGAEPALRRRARRAIVGRADVSVHREGPGRSLRRRGAPPARRVPRRELGPSLDAARPCRRRVDAGTRAGGHVEAFPAGGQREEEAAQLRANSLHYGERQKRLPERCNENPSKP